MTVPSCWSATPLCQLHFTFLFHLSHVQQAGYENDQSSYWKLDGCASARHTGVKIGKTWWTYSVFLVILMIPEWYQVKGETESFYKHCHRNFLARDCLMLSTRNSASHLADILLLLQWFISPQRDPGRDHHLHMTTNCHNNFFRGIMRITRHLSAKPFVTALGAKPSQSQLQIIQKYFFSY